MVAGTEPEGGLIYNQSPDGIHVFKFVGDGGIDRFFEILENILKTSPTDTTLRYIVELDESNNTGMRDLVKRFGKLQRKVPVRAPGRTAIVHKGDVFTMLANTFLNLAPRDDQAKFFQHDEYDEAVAWVLLED